MAIFTDATAAAVIGVAIVFFVPLLVEYDVSDASAPPKALGIPVRGFGVMVTIGAVVGISLAAHRARQMGISPSVMHTLACYAMASGMVGARAFYVVQYWDQFYHPNSVFRTLGALVDVTKGGLVVYGAVLASVPVGILFLRSQKLSLLGVGDILAPCVLVGLAFGRIGCFLNGCCYGDPTDHFLSCTFPAGSPVYQHQASRGWLYGFKLASRGNDVLVDEIMAGTPAERSGLEKGMIVNRINGIAIRDFGTAQEVLANAGSQLQIDTGDGKHTWTVTPWPGRSLPVHPAQLYAAIDAAVLGTLLWTFYPYRRRDGEVFALLITIHPISRILLEAIRGDEGGQFGTAVTISQWISIGILAAACVLWWVVERQPRKAMVLCQA